MSSQVVYQTNAEYYATEEVLAKNTLVILEKTKKGLLWFRFSGSQTVFQLSPTGKLQVKWSDQHEKNMLYKLVKNLLVASPNEKLIIKPLRQQTWIEYPVPKSFKVYWCGEFDVLMLKKTPQKIEKRKRQGVPRGTIKAGRCLFKKISPAQIDVLLEAFKDSGKFNKNQNPPVYKISFQQKSLKEAERMAADVINLAGWLCWKKRNEKNRILDLFYKQAIDSASPDVIKWAQEIATAFPGLAAKITSNGIEWPREVIERWKLIYKSEPPIPRSWE
ncbi:MAG: hypothetical protein QM398_07315 [Thermoproteota archaeon]|jgi:hypothetical protein|nr:hypothetical protein [Thermoproteota archaeon]NLD66728.1 hypothetical protein [Thermoproteota archaeon]